jgi:hypothetical protein
MKTSFLAAIIKTTPHEYSGAPRTLLNAAEHFIMLYNRQHIRKDVYADGWKIFEEAWQAIEDDGCYQSTLFASD